MRQVTNQKNNEYNERKWENCYLFFEVVTKPINWLNAN